MPSSPRPIPQHHIIPRNISAAASVAALSARLRAAEDALKRETKSANVPGWLNPSSLAISNFDLSALERAFRLMQNGKGGNTRIALTNITPPASLDTASLVTPSEKEITSAVTSRLQEIEGDFDTGRPFIMGAAEPLAKPLAFSYRNFSSSSSLTSSSDARAALSNTTTPSWLNPASLVTSSFSLSALESTFQRWDGMQIVFSNPYKL